MLILKLTGTTTFCYDTRNSCLSYSSRHLSLHNNMTEKTKAESSAIKVLNQRDAKDLTKKSAVEVSKDLQKLMLR